MSQLLTDEQIAQMTPKQRDLLERDLLFRRAWLRAIVDTPIPRAKFPWLQVGLGALGLITGVSWLAWQVATKQ